MNVLTLLRKVFFSMMHPFSAERPEKGGGLGQVLAASIAVMVLIVLGGCASSTSLIRGEEISVRYARVAGIEEITKPSEAPAGAIMGGFLGLMLSSGRSGRSQIASGLGGAALGAAATGALEGDRKAHSYRLVYNDGGESRFITEKGYLRVDDCVAVERGQDRGRTTHNVRRVPAEMCTRPAGQEPANVHERRARQCLDAKEQLLDAEGSEAVESAARKVSLLCQ